MLKSGPELDKLIYNMPTANTGYKYKDNSNKRSLQDKSLELCNRIALKMVVKSIGEPYNYIINI
jgi:hypothetical protein